MNVPTEVANFDKIPTTDELLRLRNTMANSIAEIQTIAYMFGYRNLDDADIAAWVLYGTAPMTNRQLQSIGLPTKPTIRGADNVTDIETTQAIATSKAVTLADLLNPA